jgi:hypothetical protein
MDGKTGKTGKIMRLWSLHPSYLDVKGLVALWREGLLALAVAKGKTRGYRNHPQLVRFNLCKDPVTTLDRYLLAVHAEASARGYAFDRSKLAAKLAVKDGAGPSRASLTVTQGQLDYEWQHLLRKLHSRDRTRWARQRDENPAVHPMFRIVAGPIEPWERP